MYVNKTLNRSYWDEYDVAKDILKEMKKKVLEEYYDDYLNSTYEPIEISWKEYSYSDVFKKMDKREYNLSIKEFREDYDSDFFKNVVMFIRRQGSVHDVCGFEIEYVDENQLEKDIEHLECKIDYDDEEGYEELVELKVKFHNLMEMLKEFD